MPDDRDLDWPGLCNVRDLGGLPRVGGGWTRRGRIVRGEDAHRLTAEGWARLTEFGVRTVVDLQHVDLQRPDEADPDRARRPADLETRNVPLDDPSEVEFWRRWGGGLDCTPLYYSAFLERFPQRVVRVLSVVADAPEGAVLVHCGSGRDRTGLIALVLLCLAGVTAEAIAEDYVASTARLEPVWAAEGLGDQTGKIAALVAGHGTTAHDAVVATVHELEAEPYLRRAGLARDRLSALRRRLVEP